MPVSLRSNREELLMPKPVSKDVSKAFEKRLKNFTFTSIPPKLEEWTGSDIVNNVFDAEYNIRNVDR